MNTEKTKGKEDTTESTDFGFAGMGQRMSDMMSMCCTREGGSPDCAAKIKSMMKMCCGPRKESAKAKRRKQ